MLTELEKSYIQRFVEEDEMVAAVVKAVHVTVSQLPYISPQDTNEILGERARANVRALEIIKETFNELRKYKGRGKEIINNLER